MAFQIKDSSDQNIKTTHYYKWLEAKKPSDIHNINTKIEYLEEQGFKTGVDKLTEEDLYILKGIEQMYFHWVIVPTLKIK